MCCKTVELSLPFHEKYFNSTEKVTIKWVTTGSTKSAQLDFFGLFYFSHLESESALEVPALYFAERAERQAGVRLWKRGLVQKGRALSYWTPRENSALRLLGYENQVHPLYLQKFTF